MQKAVFQSIDASTAQVAHDENRGDAWMQVEFCFYSILLILDGSQAVDLDWSDRLGISRNQTVGGVVKRISIFKMF